MENLQTRPKVAAMKVGITGVGGGVGQSIMKALTLSTLPIEITAIDVQPLGAGLYRAPNYALLTKPESPGGIEGWEHSIQHLGLEALIPGSDHDLLPLAAVRDDWARKGICQVLISDLDLVQVCRDKAATCRVLEQHSIPVPNYTCASSEDDAASWAEGNGYPVVIKPRSGFASRDVNVVADEEELRFYFRRTPKPILQEYLHNGGKTEEFTCSVFVDGNGVPVGTFMARRELSGGATYRAEVGFWPEIHELLMKIGRALRPRGMLNVQLRLTERGPVPFELNVRCSGTSAIRAYFGYNEPDMLLRHFVLGETLTPPTVRPGYALRYWNEVFLEGFDPMDAEHHPNGIRGEILAWP